jgi:hypothetical protein
MDRRNASREESKHSSLNEMGETRNPPKLVKRDDLTYDSNRSKELIIEY